MPVFCNFLILRNVAVFNAHFLSFLVLESYNTVYSVSLSRISNAV